MNDPTTTGKKLLAVFGTGSGDFHVGALDACQDPMHWWHANSAWWRHMRGLGFTTLSEREFLWSGDINGLDGLWHWLKPWTWFRTMKPAEHRDWYAAGWSLGSYLKACDAPIDFVAVGHSHGGNALLYGAALGAYIPVLITIATPHRKDMEAVTKKAMENIGIWVHVYDADFDKIGQAGQLGDGDFSTDRHMPLADLNLPLKAIDHSKLLRDETTFHFWANEILPAAGLTCSG